MNVNWTSQFTTMTSHILASPLYSSLNLLSERLIEDPALKRVQAIKK